MTNIPYTITITGPARHFTAEVNSEFAAHIAGEILRSEQVHATSNQIAMPTEDNMFIPGLAAAPPNTNSQPAILRKVNKFPKDLTHVGRIAALMTNATSDDLNTSFEWDDIKALYNVAGWSQPKNWRRELEVGIKKGIIMRNGDSSYQMTEKGKNSVSADFRDMRLSNIVRSPLSNNKSRRLP